MSTDRQTPLPSTAFRETLETTIRIGLVFLLLVWCFQIVRPFITPILWGFIIGVAVAPAYERVQAALGGRRKLAAAMFIVLGLTLFIVPAATLSGTMIAGLQDIAKQLHSGELRIPPPPERVADWPLVGDRVSELWSLAATNLEAAAGRLAPQLKAVGAWLLSAAANVGFAILQFVFSMIIAGILLTNRAVSRAAVERLMKRVAGGYGPRFVALCESTIRSVAIGIVGVAIIQSTLAGVGLAVAGIPGAGAWALVALFLCVVQLGPTLVLLPAVVYVFSTATKTVAVAFLIWCLFVGVVDNFLKPLLLGRGVDAPILVIFVGSIGGFLSMGIIGLFVGSVVLVLFYTLLKSWVNEDLLVASGRESQ